MELLEVKKIIIGNKEYPIKKSLRAMIEFETIAGHSIANIETLKDVAIFFYCTIKAGGLDLSYEDFLDAIDEYPEKINEFSSIMMSKEEKKK